MTYIPSYNNVVDANNSSTTLLTSGQSFTGTSTNVSGYSEINVFINANVDSATLGLQVQFSPDNSTWYTHLQKTIVASIDSKKIIKIDVRGAYFKLTYTNGETDQTGTMQITTYLITNATSHEVIVHHPKKNVDSFSKLKVVNPNTLLDLRFFTTGVGSNDIDKNTLLSVTDTSNATYYTPTYANASMTIAKTSGGGGSGYFKSQSRAYGIYQPGKSMLIYLTCILNNGSNSSGITTRCGYYDDNDGLFFQLVDGTISVVLRKGASDTAVASSAWNVDPMDGTGPSGIQLDFTKENFFIIQFAWLGVGSIRFGFLFNDDIYYCHYILNSNTLTAPYMDNPNLPIRYELIGAADGDTGSMIQGCATVISEGGYNPIGRIFCIGTISAITVGSTEVPLLAITGNNNYYHQNILPTSISVLGTSNNDSIILYMRLYLAGTSVGSVTSWTDVNASYSVMKYALNADFSSFSTTDSIILSQTYVYSRSTIVPNNITQQFLRLTSNVQNTSDIIVLSAIRINTDCDVHTSIAWEEIY
jgi:hypothetical protein